MSKRIDVELSYDPDRCDEVHFALRSMDGKPLSSQEIVEAVAETLLLLYNNHDLETAPVYDA